MDTYLTNTQAPIIKIDCDPYDVPKSRHWGPKSFVTSSHRGLDGIFCHPTGRHQYRKVRAAAALHSIDRVSRLQLNKGVKISALVSQPRNLDNYRGEKVRFVFGGFVMANPTSF